MFFCRHTQGAWFHRRSVSCQSTSSTTPRPHSAQPPGTGKSSSWRTHRNAVIFLRLYDGIRGHEQDIVLGCAERPIGGVKANPKCLSAMQPDFGNGFLYKLAFHLRHSQQIREHRGEYTDSS